jgi:hypothetical protein
MLDNKELKKWLFVELSLLLKMKWYQDHYLYTKIVYNSCYDACKEEEGWGISIKGK